MEYFDKFKVAGEWMQAISPCLEACAAGTSSRDVLENIESCAATVASEAAKKLNPCWEEKGPNGEQAISADPEFKIEIKATTEELRSVDAEVEAALDTFKCECTAEVDKVLEKSGSERGFPKSSEMNSQGPPSSPDRGAIAETILKLAGSGPPPKCGAQDPAPVTGTTVPLPISAGDEPGKSTDTAPADSAKVGDPGQPCRPAATQGEGICGKKSACDPATRIKTGRCNKDPSDNFCCESATGSSLSFRSRRGGLIGESSATAPGGRGVSEVAEEMAAAENVLGRIDITKLLDTETAMRLRQN